MLGDKMKALRKETGLSQDYIAEKLFIKKYRSKMGKESIGTNIK